MKAISKIIVPVVLLLLASIGSAARDTETQRLVSGYARTEPLRSAIFGVLAVRGTDTLARYNECLKMVPASNVKLLTTGLALTSLGPDYRFETTLAYSGEVSGGVLDGDLYIIGGGDPTIAGRTECADPVDSTFARWKALLDASGITSVKGRIIGDPRFFKRPGNDGSWQTEDTGWYYGAGPSGLNFFENAQNFRITPASLGQAPTITPTYPVTPWMSYVNSAVMGPSGSRNTVYLSNTDFGPVGEFFGNYPVGRGNYKLECSNRFPAYTCAYYFYNYLRHNGIEVDGGYADVSSEGNVRSDLLFSDVGRRAASPKSLCKLGSCKSPELWRILKDTNHESDNFYAETLFNMLSHSRFGRADRDSSLIAASELLADMGLRTDGSCKLTDGSGLSRKNYVSPEFFVRFLRKMYAGSMREYYLRSLPSPGSKSTLENRLRNAPESIKSRVKMKSGSMNGVLCFSGYILSPDGDRSKTVFFSILTNNFTASGSSVGVILDEIIVSLATE